MGTHFSKLQDVATNDRKLTVDLTDRPRAEMPRLSSNRSDKLQDVATTDRRLTVDLIDRPRRSRCRGSHSSVLTSYRM